MAEETLLPSTTAALEENLSGVCGYASLNGIALKGAVVWGPFHLVPRPAGGFCSRNASVNRVLTQPDDAHEVSATPGAPTEQRPFRMPAASVGPLHARNGRAFRSLTARGGGFALDSEGRKP